TSLDGRIPREDFSGGGVLRVWVEAVNQNGSNKSQPVVFNVEDISESVPRIQTPPQTTVIIITCFFPLAQFEDKLQGSYTVEEPDLFTVYEFQVRCACSTGLMSDWSKIHSIRTSESDPVGEVDLWRDCGISPLSSDCFLTWKARGFIHGYNLTVFYSNGSELQMSTAEPNRPYVHEIVQQLCSNGTTKWFLNATLKDVSSVSIIAYSSQGATKESFLTISTTGKEKNVLKVDLMNKENLSVSWNPPSDVSELKEYVVQYKQAGSPPGRQFDWIRVNKSQNRTFFKALLAVPSFKVETLTETKVTLHWKAIPLSEQTFNDPLGWICIPVCEPQPKISVLEVVKIKSPNLNPDGFVGPVIGDKFSQDDQREDAVPEETARLDRRYGKEPYSKMIDSDEETRGSSSEEEQFTSGYEQHFMPSPLEVISGPLHYSCVKICSSMYRHPSFFAYINYIRACGLEMMH
uniref:Fibronectin type-III domain-containing protein n=1 Tax=Neolamprologus brichardi TaxID=32507 RepID=A0A3Q4GW48_NEOBR